MISLGEASPETSLRLRACKARQDMRAAFESLPRVQTTDPTVVEEYRKAIVFQNLTLDLALKLVDTIRRYARLYELEIARSSA